MHPSWQVWLGNVKTNDKIRFVNDCEDFHLLIIRYPYISGSFYDKHCKELLLAGYISNVINRIRHRAKQRITILHLIKQMNLAGRLAFKLAVIIKCYQAKETHKQASKITGKRGEVEVNLRFWL